MHIGLIDRRDRPVFRFIAVMRVGVLPFEKTGLESIPTFRAVEGDRDPFHRNVKAVRLQIGFEGRPTRLHNFQLHGQRLRDTHRHVDIDAFASCRKPQRMRRDGSPRSDHAKNASSNDRVETRGRLDVGATDEGDQKQAGEDARSKSDGTPEKCTLAVSAPASARRFCALGQPSQLTTPGGAIRKRHLRVLLRRQGHKVYYAENTLWRCLFGLLFWDELFETGQLHSGFDWMPQCLKNKTFMRSFGREIEGKLAAVQNRTALPPFLRSVAAHWAKPNGIFAWDHVDMDALRALLRACPSGVTAMLRLMGEDYQAMRDGFPDLMTENGDAISFVEVKAEGDVIRRNQLTRLRQLNNAGIRAEIARVDFRFDPGAGLRLSSISRQPAAGRTATVLLRSPP